MEDHPKGQFHLVAGILFWPMQALQALPADRVYPLGVAMALGVGLIKARTSPLWPRMTDAVGPWVTVALVLTAGALALCVVAWGVSLIVSRFGSPVSWRRVLNLYGYVQVPRLIVGIISLGFAPLTVARPEEPDRYAALFMVLDLAALLYAVGLFLIGLGVAMRQPEE